MKYWYLIALPLLTGTLLFCTSTKKNLATQQSYDNYLQLEQTTLGITEVTSNLEVPWEIAWGPDNWIWFTEQAGRVGKINPKTGEKNIFFLFLMFG